MDRHSHSERCEPHAHSHDRIDPSVIESRRGLWAVKWSFTGLFATAILQLAVVWISGSVALLTDCIHNLADAGTALPLAIAFRTSRWEPSKRFSFGYGRIEDFAGLIVVMIVLASAIVAGYESVTRLFFPKSVSHLGAVAAAAAIGFIGNEAAAFFRIRVGREIGSAALVADGHHARIDGLTSLAVLLGAVGVRIGYPQADAAVGLAITLLIAGIAYRSAASVLARMLDGVEPGVLDELREAAASVAGVLSVSEVRARWVGHRLHAEVNIAVAPALSVAEGHAIAKDVNHHLREHVRHLDSATTHVDPADESGERYHAMRAGGGFRSVG